MSDYLNRFVRMDSRNHLLGLHAIINVKNIRNVEKLKYVENLKPLFEEINQALELNVVDATTHQFFPHGCSILYLLQESHFSGHTFVDERAICMDIFSCNKDINFQITVRMIQSFFNVKLDDINIDILHR